jgi:hypothetical protein
MSECICPFLSTNPYACKKCWPNGGSSKEKDAFNKIVDAEIKRLLELNRMKNNEK